jgi:hypothetical protein
MSQNSHWLAGPHPSHPELYSGRLHAVLRPGAAQEDLEPYSAGVGISYMPSSVVEPKPPGGAFRKPLLIEE